MVAGAVVQDAMDNVLSYLYVVSYILLIVVMDYMNKILLVFVVDYMDKTFMVRLQPAGKQQRVLMTVLYATCRHLGSDWFNAHIAHQTRALHECNPSALSAKSLASL